MRRSILLVAMAILFAGITAAPAEAGLFKRLRQCRKARLCGQQVCVVEPVCVQAPVCEVVEPVAEPVCEVAQPVCGPKTCHLGKAVAHVITAPVRAVKAVKEARRQKICNGQTYIVVE